VISIVTFQLFMLLATYWITRENRSLTARIIYMVAIAIIVRSAEFVNQKCNENWERIATQNYFDQQGIFMMIMVCAPLLLNSFIFLICCLREASRLLIQVKTKELKDRMKAKQKNASTKSGKATTEPVVSGPTDNKTSSKKSKKDN
jgi:transmembrane protein 18